MLTETQIKKLARLYNRRTMYELAAIHTDGRRVLIAYSDGKGRRDVWNCCHNRATAVVALTGSEIFDFGKRAADGAVIGEWSIRFTGRTEREAIMEGELAYVRDVTGVAA